MGITQHILDSSDPSEQHPSYKENLKNWERVSDSIKGESFIKAKETTYLPRPAGMSGAYADSYKDYIERAHFPLICGYALAGALGIIINKMPDFNVPKELEYILKNTTKDGHNIKQLFLDVIIEILMTGRAPLLVDISLTSAGKKEFRIVRYKASHLINWKESIVGDNKSLILGVLQESIPETEDIFSHETVDTQRVLYLDPNGIYRVKVYGPEGEYLELAKTPSYMGRTLHEIPLYIAGSIDNSYSLQTIPLLPVANASIQIYRKEADLANSEFLSCNPTLILTGVPNDSDLPNVVGSSVMISLPDPASRAFYTKTDTQALNHIKEHINDLYEEAIRHGIAILDTRKGVESAEALRIRQATQSASIYSVYLSALNVVVSSLKLMCRWAGYNEEDVSYDAPTQLIYGIPDSTVIKEIASGFATGVVPIEVIHRYLVSVGLLDQKVSLDDYRKILVDGAGLRKQIMGDISVNSDGSVSNKTVGTTGVSATQ